MAKTNNYAPDKTAPITDVQKSADAAKAFLALAAGNDSNRTDAEQILAELKSSYNIVPK